MRRSHNRANKLIQMPKCKRHYRKKKEDIQYQKRKKKKNIRQQNILCYIKIRPTKCLTYLDSKLFLQF